MAGTRQARARDSREPRLAMRSLPFSFCGSLFHCILPGFNLPNLLSQVASWDILMAFPDGVGALRPANRLPASAEHLFYCTGTVLMRSGPVMEPRPPRREATPCLGRP